MSSACLLATPAAGQGLSLDQAVALASERNEVVLAAKERSDATAARVGRARGTFLPSFSIEGDYTHHDEETVRHVGDDEVTIQGRDALLGQAIVRQPLFDARLFPLYKVARYERDAARYAALDTRRRVGFTAADAFLVALSQDQVLGAAQQRLELASSTLSDARVSRPRRLERRLLAELEPRLPSASWRSPAAIRRAYLELASIMNAPIDPPLIAPDYMLAAAAEPPGEPVAMIAAARERRLTSAPGSLHAKARIPPHRNRPRGRPALRSHGEPTRPMSPGPSNERGVSGRVDHLADSTVAAQAERASGRRWPTPPTHVQLRERQIELEVRRALVELNSEQASSRQAQVAAEVGRRNARESTVSSPRTRFGTWKPPTPMCGCSKPK